MTQTKIYIYMYLQKNYRALINESMRRMINKNLNLAPHSGNWTNQPPRFAFIKSCVSTWSNDEIIVARFAFWNSLFYSASTLGFPRKVGSEGGRKKHYRQVRKSVDLSISRRDAAIDKGMAFRYFLAISYRTQENFIFLFEILISAAEVGQSKKKNDSRSSLR